jgi:hypothetical protein
MMVLLCGRDKRKPAEGGLWGKLLGVVERGVRGQLGREF